MTLGALSGYTIGVTADRRADEQAALLSRRGATVVHAPVIRTLPLTEGPELRNATESLLATPPDIVAVTTGLGFRSWINAADSFGLGTELFEVLDRARILTRGPKAAGAVASFGLTAAWNAPDARTDELVAWLGDAHAAHRSATRVAVQLDGDPDSTVAQRIAMLGYDAVALPTYVWRRPDDLGPAQRLVAAIAERAVDAVTFTSAHAVDLFAEILAAHDAAGPATTALATGAVAVVCVGPVSAERARSHGLGPVTHPEHHRLGAMVQQCVRVLEPRATSLTLAGSDTHWQGRLLCIAGEEIVLSDRERQVLEVLARKPGAVVSKARLADAVWGSAQRGDHLVEVTVARLRQRLGLAGESIETVVRRGYRLNPDAA